MSQAFMESGFPLSQHNESAEIRRLIIDSLYGENANPAADDYSPGAIIYTRSDWSYIARKLQDQGINLSPEEEAELIDFASDYASLVDEEDDLAEDAERARNEMMNQGGIDE